MARVNPAGSSSKRLQVWSIRSEEEDVDVVAQLVEEDAT